MKLKLSPFLQSKPNLFIYHMLGWRIAQLYIFLLGDIYFILNRKEKKLIVNALNTVFNLMKECNHKIHTKEITKKVMKDIFAHYYEKLFIAFEEKERAQEFIIQHIESDDLEILRSKLKKGKGVVLITGHYGAIEYIPVFLSANGLEISMVAKFKTTQLREKIFAQAKKYHIKMIDAENEKNVLMTALNDLRQNKILITQCDEIEEWRPSFRNRIHFLGKITGLDRTINIIQKRAKTEVVFGVIHRYDLYHYRFNIYSLEQISGRLGFHTRELSIGETVIKFLEFLILNYPEQWYEWKKYFDIKTFHTSHNPVEKHTPMRFLNPLISDSVR